MEDVFAVVLDNMPSCIKGHVNYNRDGSYTIFLNSKLDSETQREVYIHELMHIINNDFEKKDCDTIEFNAHKYKEI